MINQKKVKQKLAKNFNEVCIKLKREGFLLSHLAKEMGISSSYLTYIRSDKRPISFRSIKLACGINAISKDDLFKGLDKEELLFVTRKIADCKEV